MSTIPTTILQGSTAAILLDAPGHLPSEGWALTLALRGAGRADVEAVAEGDTFALTIPATLPVGRYWWQAVAIKDGLKAEVASGEMEVTPSLLDAGDNFDGRSEAEIALDAVNAVLNKKATRDQQSYKIKDRELQRMTVAELLKLRSYLVFRVRREKGKPSHYPPIKVRL